MFQCITGLKQNKKIHPWTEEIGAFSGALHDYNATEAFLNNPGSWSLQRLEIITIVQAGHAVIMPAEIKILFQSKNFRNNNQQNKMSSRANADRNRI